MITALLPASAATHVRGLKNGALNARTGLDGALEQLPGELARARVHAGRHLVKEDHLQAPIYIATLDGERLQTCGRLIIAMAKLSFLLLPPLRAPLFFLR